MASNIANMLTSL